MEYTKIDQTIIDRLVRWAEGDERIRAMLLYSSRANPHAQIDAFSDYDILLAVTDLWGFHQDDRWLEAFGEVLVVFRNPIGVEDGFECFGFITHYLEGVKIDYGFYPVEFLAWAAKQPQPPDDLDNGYLILLDKDHLTDGLQPPTFTAYTPAPPSEREYQAIIDEFFNDAAYAAKNLWRGYLFPLKDNLETIMKFHCLRQMLEWRMGIATNWSVKPGAHGKGLQRWVASDVWAELEATYVGAGAEENWAALFRTIDLFRKVALVVAGPLSYTYPMQMDQRVVAYLEKTRQLCRPDPGIG